MIINEYHSDIVLAVLHQRIGIDISLKIYSLESSFLDFIINKKIFDHFDSYDKLEEHKCPTRKSLFTIYPVSSYSKYS
jgi:hypothetical protein